MGLLFGYDRKKGKKCCNCRQRIDISADRCPYCYSKQPSWADNPLEFVRRFGCIGAPTIIGIIIVIFYLLANYWDDIIPYKACKELQSI